MKVFRSLYCFIAFISHGAENYFPRLRGMGICDAIFSFYNQELGLLQIHGYYCMLSNPEPFFVSSEPLLLSVISNRQQQFVAF